MPCCFLLDLCSSDCARRHRGCVQLGRPPICWDSFHPTEAPGPPPGSLQTPAFAPRLSLPQDAGTRGYLGCEESPSQDRVGLTLTSPGLSPPEVQPGCGGAAIYARGVEKLDKVGLLTPTAKGLFLGVGVGGGGCIFWAGAHVCQDPLVTVSE